MFFRVTINSEVTVICGKVEVCLLYPSYASQSIKYFTRAFADGSHFNVDQNYRPNRDFTNLLELLFSCIIKDDPVWYDFTEVNIFNTVL